MKKLIILLLVAALYIPEGIGQPEQAEDFKKAGKKVKRFREKYNDNGKVKNVVTLHRITAVKDYLNKYDSMIRLHTREIPTGFEWNIGLYVTYYPKIEKAELNDKKMEDDEERMSFLLIPTLYNRDTEEYLDYFDGETYDPDEIAAFNEGQLEPFVEDYDRMGEVEPEIADTLVKIFKEQFQKDIKNNVIIISRQDLVEYVELFDTMTSRIPPPAKFLWHVGFYPFLINKFFDKDHLGFYLVPTLYTNPKDPELWDYFVSEDYNRSVIKVYRAKQVRPKKPRNVRETQ